MPNSLFSPSTSIASAIANEFNEAGGYKKSALMELGLLLCYHNYGIDFIKINDYKMQQNKREIR